MNLEQLKQRLGGVVKSAPPAPRETADQQRLRELERVIAGFSELGEQQDERFNQDASSAG